MSVVNYLGVKVPNIRTIQHNGQTHYSVVDVWTALSDNEKQAHSYYTFKPRHKWIRDLVVKLKLPCRGLSQDPTDCANAEGILRIICVLKSEKAEIVRCEMSKALSDKLKQAKGTSLVKFIESIE